MLRHLQGLRTQGKKQENFESVIKGDSQTNLKKMLEKARIVTLSLEKYKDDATTFGTIKVKIAWDNEEYLFMVKHDNISACCSNFLRLGLEVTDINTMDQEIDNQQVQLIISGSKDMLKKEKEQELEQKMAKQEKMKKEFGSNTRNNIANIVKDTIQKIEALKVKAQEVINGNELKKLEESIDEIKKLSRSSNKDKMTNVLEDIFLLIDTIEQRYTSKIQEDSTPLFKGTTISDADLIKEHGARKKSQYVAKAGTTKTGSDNFYILMGKAGVFVNFIKKDMLKKTNNISDLIFELTDMIEFVLLFLAIDIGFFIIYQQFLFGGTNDSSFYHLVQIGILGFSFTATRFIKKKSLRMIILRIILSVALYIILTYAISIKYVLH